MKRAFPTLDVVGAWSGVTMESGFLGVHDVFAFLFPKIVSGGSRVDAEAMLSVAKEGRAYLSTILPRLRELPVITQSNFKEVGERALRRFGPMIEVEGPARARRKCIVKNCTNKEGEGNMVGELCFPCWHFIAEGCGVHCQAFRNSSTAVARALDHFVRTHEMLNDDREVLVP